MLPLMYLIDSICKNHGSPYKEMFNHNLVSNFAYIFQQVSEKVSFLSAFLTTLKSWFQPKITFFLPSKLWSLTNTNLKSKPINQDFKASSPKELAKAAQVRSNLYKLRITWGGNFQIFTPAVLHQVGQSFQIYFPA